jgi:hypothetical protein
VHGEFGIAEHMRLQPLFTLVSLRTFRILPEARTLGTFSCLPNAL